MNPDDREQLSPPVAPVSQEKRNAIAEKVLYRKSLNAEDRQTIYLALTEEWEPMSFFCKKRGPKFKAAKHRGLAEDVEKLRSEGKDFRKHMGDLGKTHKLQGLEKVTTVTFDNNLDRGEESLAQHRLFLKNLATRKSRKI